MISNLLTFMRKLKGPKDKVTYKVTKLVTESSSQTPPDSSSFHYTIPVFVCLYIYANSKFTTFLKNSTQPSIYPLHIKLDMFFLMVVDHKNGIRYN